MADAKPAPADARSTQVSGPRTVSKPGDDAAKAHKATILGDFKLQKKLGQGGMGVVYLAHQLSLDRPCALKVLSKDLAAKPGFVERFTREARSMAKIDHPNVVRCFAVGEEKGLHYVAMELIDGKSMQDWLEQLGKLSVPDAIHVTLLCADAIKHAHGLNMIHRDIKPDNILVTSKGGVKVSDLGLAKALDEDMSMTQSGTGLGTPHYMPPEQARNAKHVDHRSDIYALGGTLYHFVAGKTPFAGESIVELITNKERGSFTSARKLNPEVPERLDLIIHKAMARDPQHRYQSCDEFIRDLESLNLASESLSFIAAPDKFVMRRAGVGGAGMRTTASTRAGFTAPSPAPVVPRTSAEDAAARKRPVYEESPGLWYVRHTDSSGHIKVSQMNTGQVLAAIKNDVLDHKAQATRNPKGPFLPLAQIREFEGEAQRLLTRAKIKAKEHNLAEQYAKIEKQYKRQKWWRLLARWREGTLGLIGFILYMAVVIAVLATAVFGVWYAWEKLGEKYLDRTPPAHEQRAEGTE
jgi:serine/threonine-protein kinase